VQGVLDARLLLLHLDFGCRTDLDQGNAASELGNALLQLFLVVVAGRGFDLRADLLDACLDVGADAGTVDDRRVFLADFDALGLAEVGQGCLFERQADFFGDHLAAGEDRDVFEHGFAAVAKARRLDGAGLQDAADVVHHQGGERFAIDVFGDDQQRTARLGNLFENRQQVTDVRDLLVEDQDTGSRGSRSASRCC
jgi:hypothetical protein